MKAIETSIPGVSIVVPEVFGDERGFFKEVIHPQKLAKIGINHRFVQVNHSKSQQGTLRGLHFQLPPYAQSKFVRVLTGKIFDVAVDIRPKSKTFKQAVGVELSSDNHHMLYVPTGFAHGFYAMTDCEVEYACGEIYSPTFERGMKWNDPEIDIEWPSDQPILSEKDDNAPSLKDILSELVWTDDINFTN
ncbi:MAG: dTDP-4-dehydrorhamnose 3,5-epimerase [Candidatus Margulisiibacteriota bacterium]